MGAVPQPLLSQSLARLPPDLLSSFVSVICHRGHTPPSRGPNGSEEHLSPLDEARRLFRVAVTGAEFRERQRLIGNVNELLVVDM